ncbi:MBOAT family O-acyltransferase [Chitinophaga rhizophila]|uniref:MBOAT family O-acyltransferase n=1 Tax=Chitinophaga rhizophila TaxID=2866212 RepID=UPI001F31821D|nr:MBOAT family O-acyltransferase [Chitinophaga rhizophila]
MLYWLACRQRVRLQNLLLLVASYFFYACWDWRFLFLLIFSTILNFGIGIQIEGAKTPSAKRRWFWLSICLNMVLLGVFKYYDFFVLSLRDSLSGIGVETNLSTLDLILPIGISFYTFHGLSYVIDIYLDRIRSERNYIDYAFFVSFFPLLIAGPIERATHLLPQLKATRTFDYDTAVDGMRQILWGLFKKIVIADNCARFANILFDPAAEYSGSSYLLGAFFFSIQIYGDFSGYSDIAIGTARLLGINLLRNFAYPYFSRDIAEFWRRWHISLTTWFRDYLYFPLGGNRRGLWRTVLNTFIIFLVSGLWHGANWTFIVWGVLNACYFLPLLLLGKNRQHLDIVAKGRRFPSFTEFRGITFTFTLTTIAWIFFRAESLTHAWKILRAVFSPSLFQWPSFPTINYAYVNLILVFFFLWIEWLGREEPYAIAKFGQSRPAVVRVAFYLLIGFMIFSLQGRQNQFIYFQF